jgi:hypothetical protein
MRRATNSTTQIVSFIALFHQWKLRLKSSLRLETRLSGEFYEQILIVKILFGQTPAWLLVYRNGSHREIFVSMAGLVCSRSHRGLKLLNIELCVSSLNRLVSPQLQTLLLFPVPDPISGLFLSALKQFSIITDRIGVLGNQFVLIEAHVTLNMRS